MTTAGAAAAPARAQGAAGQTRLPAYAAFAAMLAAAGLPIYIHAPKFYVDSYGAGLAALGQVLFALRLLDVVQDPLLGRLSEALAGRRALAAGLGTGVLALAMLGLFAVTPPVAPLIWFAAMLTLLFSAFSFLTVTFYAEGVAKAGALGGKGHLRLAAWRETGALLGVCTAAAAPALLGQVMGAPFAGFAVGFVVLAVAAALSMRPEWGRAGTLPPSPFRQVLADQRARRLLLIALVNAAPVAVTATLFLFYVESRLAAPGWEGPFLLLFFLSAAAAAPFWSRAAQAKGTRRALLAGMLLSVVAFAGAALLGAGDVALFAAVCIASGAALGADMTLLPALFAARMEKIAPSAAAGFGLWSFASKFTLAFAAVTLLPALEAAGFRPGQENNAEALWTLGALYALVPCALKLVAAGLLLTTPCEEE